MIKARQGKEIVIRAPNEIGALAKLTKIVAERGITVLAVSAWTEREKAVIRLVADDTLRTMDVLRNNGYEPHEQAVVLVDARHTPGILRHLTEVLSKEGIDLLHLFASATINQDVCLLVLNCSDNDRAITLLNERQTECKLAART